MCKKRKKENIYKLIDDILDIRELIVKAKHKQQVVYRNIKF